MGDTTATPYLVKFLKGVALNISEALEHRLCNQGLTSRKKRARMKHVSREAAEKAVPTTDCSGRMYKEYEREDLIRSVLDGAEIQRDIECLCPTVEPSSCPAHNNKESGSNKELGEAYIDGSGRLIQRVLETIEHTPEDIFTKEVVINLIHRTKELFDEQTKEMME